MKHGRIHSFRTRRGAERLKATCAAKFPLHTFAVVNHPSEFKFCVAVMLMTHNGTPHVRAYVERVPARTKKVQP